MTMKAEILKKSILQYAIQGKLVPQIETEDPASTLLEKIKWEKQELIKQGKLKKSISLSSVLEDEMPFELPVSWLWVRFDDVAVLFTGDSINAEEKEKKYTNLAEGYNYIATKDVWFDNSVDYDNGIKIPFGTHFKIAKANSSLLCIEGGSAGRKVGLINQNVCFGNKLCAFEPIIIDVFYLFYYLQAPSFTDNFKDNKSGMIGGVGVNTLKTLCFALPPLAEQHRIVARIEELMTLVDEYEKNEVELSTLEKEFPEMLKKSILQYAIQGKLVPQIENEEPASALLERIKQEKQELIKQGKMKREKPLAEILEDEKPFEIPDSWEWVRLGTVCNKLTDGTHSTPKYTQSGIPFLSVKDMSNGKLDFSNTRFISEKEHRELYKRCNPEQGDLLLTKVGTTGVPVIVNTDREFSLFVSVALLKLSKRNINLDYLCNVIKSPLVYEQSQDNTKGVGNKNWVMRDIATTIFPLPPLAEQQRIVARVEELFALVDLLASGKKIKKDKPITSAEAKTENNVTVLPQRKTFDIGSLKIAARQENGVDEQTVSDVLNQVKEYYDKKN